MGASTHMLRRIIHYAIFGIAGLVALPSSGLVINMVVTPRVGFYHYDVMVHNDEVDDLILVSIIDAPLGDPLIDPTLVSPPGFLGNYDDGLGFLDFLSDADIFTAGTIVGPFSFDSGFAPGTYFTMVEAWTEGLDRIGGSVRVVLVDAVPENGSAGLLMAIALGALAWTRRAYSTSDRTSNER